ncbi:MAG: AIR synthase family protein [Dehalococcoidia bacterium]|nr:AIR synthase family protein [Dehalococcoidia bacterium]
MIRAKRDGGEGEAVDIGKLPNQLLGQLLARIGPDVSGRVVVGPGVGQDAAVIDMGQRLLVAKSDPITFASDLIGWYAVHINANDVACMGAKPAWFLATVLLPQGASQSLAEGIFDQILDACRQMEVELVGGHIEITHRLDRPIVVGAMLGEVERDRLVRGSGAQPGDDLILTKGIAIEGTAVLAREAADALRRKGVAAAVLETASGYIFQPGISVVREALLAVEKAAVHAMHDPTEGGLATALYEMAEASGVGMWLEEAAIPVLPATQAVCRAAGLDPLGLMASGALLIALPPQDADRLLAALAEAGIAAGRIGTVTPQDAGVIIGKPDGGRMALPTFARDEVARFLAQEG